MTEFSVPASEEEWDHLIARAAARRAGITSTAATDVAFASMLGFSTDLAELVLEHDFLQDQLRGYWAEHGVPGVITALADTPSNLGNLHQQLIDVAGSGVAQGGATGSDSEGCDDNDVEEPFQAVESGSDPEFFQNPLPNDRTLIEAFLSTDVAEVLATWTAELELVSSTTRGEPAGEGRLWKVGVTDPDLVAAVLGPGIDDIPRMTVSDVPAPGGTAVTVTLALPDSPAPGISLVAVVDYRNGVVAEIPLQQTGSDDTSLSGSLVLASDIGSAHPVIRLNVQARP